MTEFETALEFFIEGRLELAGLQAVLARSLETDPASASQCMQALRGARQSGRLPDQVYVALAQQISPLVPAPPSEPPAEPPGDSDKTQLKMPPGTDKTQLSSPPQYSQPTRVTQPGDSISQRQSTTGATGATGTGTSTGSTWGDPGKWADQPVPTLQTGSILKNRFVLEKEIGRGGMGVIFKARDVMKEEAQDRDPYVAVKILNDEFRRHPDSLKALQRESRKAQILAHPNILNVHDFDRDGPIVYMTMEYLEGESLDRIIKKPTFQGMPPVEALPLIRGLSLALAYAHNKGIVHSDFKSGNVFLTNDGNVKVFDFGIARASKLPGQHSGDETKFDPGTLGALTPAYASCEMLEGLEPDPRDDIYALACVSYEILTGKHPFGKRPATEARDNGLTPAPIKGLSRRNWRGLQKGLAFKREERSASVEEFLDDLRIRKLNKTMVGLGTAAAIALIAIVAIQGPAYLEQRRIDDLVAAIVAGSDTDIPVVLQRLSQFEAETQGRVIEDGRVEDRLIAYYDDQIELAYEALDYPRAEALMAEALALYDDSNTLNDANEALAEKKAEKLAELDDRYNASLEAGDIMPSDGDDITKVLDEYERVDPDHPALTDSQLASAYADLADQMLQRDLQQAALVVDTAQQRFPNDARLIGLQDRINTLREVQDIELRVAELEQELSDGLASIAGLQDFQPYEAPLRQMSALDPENSIGAAMVRRLEELVDEAVEAALSQNNWPGARSTLEAYAGILPQDRLTAALSRVDSAETKYNAQVGGVLAGVQDAVGGGDLDRAVRELRQLEQLNAAPGSIRQAREIVTRGYLGAAQQERGAGRFDEARDLIASGQVVDPSYTEWQAELDAISQSEQLAGQALAVQERQRMQQERQARIDTLEGRIRANLTRSPFGLETASDTMAAVDELARAAPGNQLATQGRSEIAAKLATEARGLAARDQRYDDGLELLARSIELLPAEQELRRAQSEIEASRRDYLASVAAGRADELRGELERLVAAPAYDSAWEQDLRRVIQGLEPLASDADYVSAKRQEIARLYVARAESLRSEERFDLAGRMLDASGRFVGDFGPAVRERQLLTEAKRAFDQANAQRDRMARIEGLKRTFTTELNALRIPDARRALGTLGELLGANDPFIAREAPGAIADTYARMAQTAFGENRFDRAEDLAREGLKEVADHPALSQLVVEIPPRRLQVNRDRLQATLRNAAPANPAEARTLLASVRKDAGSDLAEIDAELKKLADQRVAADKNNRDALANWYKGIFGNYVPPPLEGLRCTANLAGYGSRGRAQCFDYLPGSSEEGPRLVVIPPGSGIARPYAISRQEVSVGQWNAYCRLSGNCSPRAGQNEQYPITNISVSDANAYVAWLSQGTNHVYRLPTDLEWEHAARATGSASISPNCINPQAGLLGDSLLEVNRGGQNAWGVMNYEGNAQEWVVGASGGYEARGGSYKDRLGNCGIEMSSPHSGTADGVTGFRLLRELGGDA